MHDQLTGGGFTGEADFGDAVAAGERLTGFQTKAVHDIDDTCRQQITDDFHQYHDAEGGLLCGLKYHRVARRQSWSQFPRRHQDGEVPRDDLCNDAQGFVVVVSQRILVHLANAAFLSADDACEITEVVDGQWDVCIDCFADALAVVQRFGQSQYLQVLFDPVSNLVQDVGTLGGAGLAPSGRRCMGCIQCGFDIVFI